MSLVRTFRDTIYPKLCVFCAREVVDEDAFVCELCAERLVRTQASLCKTCGHAVHLCSCNVPKTLSAARFVFWYEGIVKRYVIAMKRDMYEELYDYGAMRLHKLLAQSEYLPSFDSITYVPRSRRAYYEALVDPAYELAKRISAITGIPCEDYLSCRMKLYDQKALSERERRENVKGAFCMAKNAPTPCGKILLIDDIMTTGSTANECAKVLKKAGPCEVAGLFLARTHHIEH